MTNAPSLIAAAAASAPATPRAVGLSALLTFVTLVCFFQPAIAAAGDSSPGSQIEVSQGNAGSVADLEIVESDVPSNASESPFWHDVKTVELRVGDRAYQLLEPSEAEREPFEKLGIKQEKFLDKRQFILTSTARALQMMNYGIGIGSVIGEKITFIAQKIRGQSGQRQERRSLSERAHAIINALLQALDRKLWSSARVIADYNEVHFFIAPGVFAFGGKKTETESGRVVTGWGGAYNLVLSFGFNREKRGLVFEIVREVEVFKDTVLPRVFLAGGAVNFGLAFRVRDGEGFVDMGNRYKPPAAPLTTTDGEKMLMISSGPGATIPPPPFGDAVTNTNLLENAPIFRVLISPNIKGWIHIHSDLPRIAENDAAMIFGNVEKFASYIQSLSTRYRAGGQACRALFAD